MKSKISILALLFSIGAGCSKVDNSTSVSDVIYNLRTDSTTILADGTSLVHVSVELDSMATTDRLGVLFKINTGNFAGATGGGGASGGAGGAGGAGGGAGAGGAGSGGASSAADTTEIIQAQFIGKSLVATAVIQVPQMPGLLIISAQPSVPTVQDYNRYILKDTVQLLPSAPDTIILTSSSVGIASNFGSQVTITGALYNSAFGKVSLNYKVSFQDSLAGPISAGGYWTSIVDTSNVLSQVSAVYSFGPSTVGTPIYLSCTLLDPTGAKTPVEGKTTIYINK